MRKSLLLLAFLVSELSFSFPQTIVHEYPNCKGCHVSAAGGSVLTDYGRHLSEYMSTFNFSGEAKELIVTESEKFDLGFDYRHLGLFKKELPFVQFPMAIELETAVHFNDKLTLALGVGAYGRDLVIESRESWAQYEFFKDTTLRAGYFMPVFGINTNDHSLAIKRQAGLGRGSEGYGFEIWHYNQIFEVFFTSATKQFEVSQFGENFYRILTPEGVARIYARFGITYFDGIRFGSSLFTQSEFKLYGFWSYAKLFEDTYVMAEHDIGRESNASYGRLGYYLFQGFDTFIEYDREATRFFNASNLYLGVDWMVRPRINLSLKINFGDGYNQAQSHIWY